MNQLLPLLHTLKSLPLPVGPPSMPGFKQNMPGFKQNMPGFKQKLVGFKQHGRKAPRTIASIATSGIPKMIKTTARQRDQGRRSTTRESGCVNEVHVSIAAT